MASSRTTFVAFSLTTILWCIGQAASLASDLPTFEDGLAKRLFVSHITVPFRKVSCLNRDLSCAKGPPSDPPEINIGSVIYNLSSNTEARLENKKICIPVHDRLKQRVPDIETTKQFDALVVPISKETGTQKISRLIGVNLLDGDFNSVTLLLLNGERDESDFPPQDFRREVIDYCSTEGKSIGNFPVFVSKIVRAQIALQILSDQSPSPDLVIRLAKEGFVRSASKASPFLFINQAYYSIGFSVIPLRP